MHLYITTTKMGESYLRLHSATWPTLFSPLFFETVRLFFFFLFCSRIIFFSFVNIFPLYSKHRRCTRIPQNFRGLCFSLCCRFAWGPWFRNFWHFRSFRWFWLLWFRSSLDSGFLLPGCCRSFGRSAWGFRLWLCRPPFIIILFTTGCLGPGGRLRINVEIHQISILESELAF